MESGIGMLAIPSLCNGSSSCDVKSIGSLLLWGPIMGFRGRGVF